MPARLYFSNSLDALAERMRANLAQEGGDPLAVSAIATPSPAVRDWLKVRLAEQAGVAAGLSFPHLENLLWNELAARDRYRDDPTRLPARLLDGFGFQGLVLARLREHPPEALRAYLREQGGDDADRARRLCQLAGRLAALFREYEYNRVAEHGHSGLIECWMGGRPSFEPHLLRGRGHAARLDELRGIEAWQMEVYHAIFREGDGLRDRWGAATKTYRYTLPQYATLALRDPVPPSEAPRTIHLFGLSNISPFHRDLIGRLADPDCTGDAPARFEIYALNPCAEFWEDVLTLRERRARGRRTLTAGVVPPERIAATRPDAAELAEGAFREEDDENGLLARFGKPGRETIKLWCQLTDHDFHEDFRVPRADGLLGAVQESVLHREGPRPPERRLRPDATLRQILAPDARAELEIVRAEIARALQDDPGLRPEDCAVLMADPASALPLLRAVFAGGADAPGNVPVLFPEGDTLDEAPLLAAFRTALALGATAVDRTDLLALLAMPGVSRKTGLEADRMDAVADFLEHAGFQEGWEANEGTGAHGSSLAEAALRAVLATALDPEDPALDAVARAEAGFPWPAEDARALLERAEAARVLEWLETLRTRTLPLRDGRARTWEEWADCLRSLRDALCEPGPEDTRAAFDLNRFLDDLANWGGWSANEGAPPADRADAVLVRTVFEDRFRDTGGAGRTALLRGGVRAGGLTALRGLPFRKVWVTGLTAAFPAPGESAPLDLRGYRRLPGESDPSARDLYALLELITATTDALVLSRPALDTAGKDTQPSRALTALGAWLESDLLAEDARFEPEEIKPESLPRPVVTPVLNAPRAWIPEERVQSFCDWKHLKGYLENPAWHAASRRFRVEAYDLLDTKATARAAALFLTEREERDLLRDALRAELLQSGSAAAFFDGEWERRRRAGLLPRAPYDALAEAKLRAGLEQAVSKMTGQLAPALEAAGLRLEGSLRLGPQTATAAEPPVRNLPAFDATPLGMSLHIGGIFPTFFAGRDPESGAPAWGLMVEHHDLVAAWLLQLCSLTLAAETPRLHEAFSGNGYVFVPDFKKRNIKAYPLPALDTDAARGWLADLLADHARDNTEGRYGDLPLEIVAELLENHLRVEDPLASVSDWVEAIEDARLAEAEKDFGKPRYQDRLVGVLSPAVPDDAAGQIRRRVLPYLQWRDRILGKDKKGGENEPSDATGGEA